MWMILKWKKKPIPKRIRIEKTRCNKIVSCVECQPRPIDVNSKNCRIKHTIFQSTKTPHTHYQSRQHSNERTSTKIQIKINENNNWIELNVLYIQYFFLSVFNFVFVFVFVCWFLLWFVISCTFLKIIDIFFSRFVFVFFDCRKLNKRQMCWIGTHCHVHCILIK